MTLSALLPPLDEVLAARERRWTTRERLAARATVLSATLRLPHALRLAYPDLMRRLKPLLADQGFHLLQEDRTVDGPEAFYAASCSGGEAKRRAMALEETTWGGFFDLDVRTGRGVVSRADLGRSPRACLVCGAPAWECIERKAHSEDEVRRALESALRPEGVAPVERIARSAVLAAEEELRLLFKPGLVTPVSSGSHDDMTFDDMLASLSVLEGYWEKSAALGFEAVDCDARLLEALRPWGIEAEGAMFSASGGVNTYRGLIYLLGILCGAAGFCARSGEFKADAVFAAAGRMAADEVRRTPSLETRAGRRGLFFAGARGEAHGGYPLVGAALKRLQKALRDGLGEADAAVNALLFLMSETEDSNVAGRGGRQGLQWLQRQARRLMEQEGVASAEGTEGYRRFCAETQERRLSPGGSADLLVCTLFMNRLINFSSEETA